MNSKAKKSKFNKKILAAITIIIIASAAITAVYLLNDNSQPTTTPPVAIWDLTFSGGKTVNMTNLVFEDHASQHPATWNQNDANGNSVWAGTPLYQLVNWYANNDYISTGVLSLDYNVSVIGSDGYTIVLEKSRIQANNNIIIANNANGTALSDKYYPLALTGSDVTKKESVKGIAQIQINTALPSNMTLTIIGANGTTLSFDTAGIAALPSVSGMGGRNSHGEIKGVGNYTGISIFSLVDMVGGMPSNSFIRLTAADTYTKDFTYEQIMSGTGYATFDPVTNNETEATQPITAILAYAVDGTVVSSSDLLRSACVGPEGLLTISSIWVKMTVQVDVVQLA
jgi:DMSO/TMAO reductase YedYZ molybdopterin-dependent catalytic subunit